MRLINTLTKEQKISILNGNSSGIFPTMILSSDVYFSLTNDLCFGYYFSRSGNKTVSPIYERIEEFADDNLSQSRDELIGKFIRSKFNVKWTKIYNALIESDYDVLTNNDFNVKTILDSTDKTTYDTTISKDGSNSDNTTYDTTIEDNGKTGTKTVTTNENENKTGLYGFNSDSSVDSDTENGNSTETVIGNADDNTTYNKQDKTGTENKQFTIDESEIKSGSDTLKKDSERTIDKTARNMTGAELIEKELSLRSKQLFFDIVYKDIDSIATLEIYI